MNLEELTINSIVLFNNNLIQIGYLENDMSMENFAPINVNYELCQAINGKHNVIYNKPFLGTSFELHGKNSLKLEIVDLDGGNQMVFISQLTYKNELMDLVTIHNQDIHGRLSFHRLQSICLNILGEPLDVDFNKLKEIYSKKSHLKST